MIELIRPGLTPYARGLAMQLMLRERLREREGDPRKGFILALEHERTVTLGRRGEIAHLMSPTFLAAQGVEVFRIDRGGEATYHEPGQLVVYPILDLKALNLGVVDLIRNMAACLAQAMAPLGLSASYDPDHPGLWTHEAPRRKVASVGMRVSRQITTHGVAANLINPMQGFGWIIPCGMPQAPMTRLLDHVSPAPSAPRAQVFERVEADFLERLAAYLGQPLTPAPAPAIPEAHVAQVIAAHRVDLAAL